MLYPIEIKSTKVHFIRFMGASYEMDGDTKVYSPIGEIYLNPTHISGFYDHTIMVKGYKIRVMETVDEIAGKL